ncbi:MAG: sigma-54-dependent Fis family transcriptional regulator [Myxococcota bacterium]
MERDVPPEVARALDRLRALDAATTNAVEEPLQRLLRATRATVWAQQRLPALAAAATESELLQVLVDEAIAFTGAPEAWAMTWVDEGSASQVRALAGSGAGRTADGAWLVPSEISKSILGRVAEDLRPAWSDDATADARFFGAESIQAMALRSVGCIPIGSRGALYLHDPDTPGRFTTEARYNLPSLCRLVAAMLPAPTPDRPAAPGPAPLAGLVGRAPAMRELYAAVRAFAPMPWPVLVLGETGTGKEAVARAVHDLSGRAGPFVAVNAANLGPELAESELFGHERGAFTGAVRAREGRLAEAGTGTLFLDEVGELPPTVQAKLLRLLQEGVFRRIGGDRDHTFAGRIVAATNQPIDQSGDRFRLDLYHRLSACVVRTPALREHPEDLPELVDHLLARVAAEADLPPPQTPPQVIAALQARAWPGNVRELLNVLRGAVALVAARGQSSLSLADLPAPADLSTTRPSDAWPAGLELATTRFQQERVRAALVAHGGNRTQAARALEVSRQWLHRLIARWNEEGSW